MKKFKSMDVIHFKFSHPHYYELLSYYNLVKNSNFHWETYHTKDIIGYKVRVVYDNGSSRIIKQFICVDEEEAKEVFENFVNTWNE